MMMDQHERILPTNVPDRLWVSLNAQKRSRLLGVRVKGSYHSKEEPQLTESFSFLEMSKLRNKYKMASS
jgi:hypothetical protein